MKKFILGFIIGGILFSGITVFAIHVYHANEIPYSPKNTSWNVSNVKTALDSLDTDFNNYRSGMITILRNKGLTLNDNADLNDIKTALNNVGSFSDSKIIMLGLATWDDGDSGTATYSHTCTGNGTLLAYSQYDNGAQVYLNGGRTTGAFSEKNDNNNKVKSYHRAAYWEGRYPFIRTRVKAGDVVRVDLSHGGGWTWRGAMAVIVYD